MNLHKGQTGLLIDARQRRLGQVIIERGADDLITGTFQPGPDFPAVEPLFRAFEEAVNSQALAVVDELDAAIAALDLRLMLPGNSAPLAIRDVQIWSDGGFSSRSAFGADIQVNGDQAAARLTQRTRE